jgi:hypothetical protein
MLRPLRRDWSPALPGTVVASRTLLGGVILPEGGGELEKSVILYRVENVFSLGFMWLRAS